jgi:hypothetical protein
MGRKVKQEVRLALIYNVSCTILVINLAGI